MPPTPQAELAPILQWHPWPPGDPAPEIWRLIYELDRRVQVQVAQAVLEAQIGQLRAQVDGLTKVQKIITGAKVG